MHFRITMEYIKEINAASIEDAAEKTPWLIGGLIKQGKGDGKIEPIIRLLRIEQGSLPDLAQQSAALDSGLVELKTQ